MLLLMACTTLTIEIDVGIAAEGNRQCGIVRDEVSVLATKEERRVRNTNVRLIDELSRIGQATITIGAAGAVLVTATLLAGLRVLMQLEGVHSKTCHCRKISSAFWCNRVATVECRVLLLS